MNDNDINLAAKILFDHRLNKTGLSALPKRFQPRSIEESYNIQNQLKLFYLTLSKNICIGKKVGCTNKLAQKQIDVYEPFYGNLFSKYSSDSDCKLKLKNFFNPFIEPEISFRIKSDININNYPFKFTDAFNLFDYIVPSIEIVDFRFGTNIKKIGIKNLIMTNGASEYWVKSKKTFSLKDINLNNHEIKIYINDKLIEKGNTNLVLDNPINSAIWVINKLAYNGEPMLRGQYISTGTCTKAIQIKKESLIKADFGILGEVKINFYKT